MNRLITYLKEETHIAPLAVFRILFGAIMFISILRFIMKGWVYELYIMPEHFFSFYGFEWIKPLGDPGMYLIFGVMAITALMVMAGLFYRYSAAVFFLAFSYVELIDKTNYLNHYYFVSIISFLLIFLPAHRYFSLDVLRNKNLKVTHVQRWIPGILKLQLALVYLFAGMAKLNYDWLIEAMPLRIWLPANAHLPVIGPLLDEVWVVYLFSWFGAFYDILIPFFLFVKRTRLAAYGFVIAFHVMTRILFPIGMFPYIMILSTLIFFSAGFHLQIIAYIKKGISFFFGKGSQIQEEAKIAHYFSGQNIKYAFVAFIGIHFLIQLLVPLRSHLYDGKLFWTEQGYRFSWRVMLMEKAGTAFFYVKDPETGRQSEVMAADYLTKNQEKMMATQPDMILQFAHIIAEDFKSKGIKEPEVYVQSYVTLNGSGSMPFIKEDVNLAAEKESFKNKKWVLPFGTDRNWLIGKN